MLFELGLTDVRRQEVGDSDLFGGGTLRLEPIHIPPKREVRKIIDSKVPGRGYGTVSWMVVELFFPWGCDLFRDRNDGKRLC